MSRLGRLGRFRRLAPTGGLITLLTTQTALTALIVPTALSAQIAERFGVPMRARDGIKLVSDLYLPADSGRWPAILVRTPYLRTFNDGLFAKHGRTFAAKGYAYVVQDVRGRGDSEGEFDFFFQEGKDGYDAVEWIARQPWSNGRVCTMGVSYMGTVQWLAAREKPPHLVCAVPTAAAGRWGEELPWMGGVFLHTFSLRFLNDLSGRYSQGATAAGSDWDRIIAHRPLLSADSVLGRRIRLYREWASHPVIDAYWKRILFTETTFKSLDIPTLTVTGLYDGDQPGALFYWRGMQANSPARDRQWLVLGPWNHVQTYAGGVEKLQGMELGKESIIDNLQEHLAFFDVFLKRTRPSYDKPRARVFVTGSNRWREFPSYPVPGAEERSLYLHSGGRANSRGGDGTLSWTAPNDESPDAYNYDPANPVPLSEEDLAGPGEGTRPIDSRPDVLVYSTAALTEPVEVIGSVVVKLIASSDGKDTDFTATLLDVAPDGMILRIGLLPGIRRARARKGNDRVVFLTPGVADTIPIQLFDVAHTFRSGHRIRLEVSSSAAPLFAPNPNTGLPIATDTTSRVARNTVYHDRARASQVILPVIK